MAHHNSSPASIEELRGVLAVANRFAIPVWTFSRGKNLGCTIYAFQIENLSLTILLDGGPAPKLNGSAALDLHRMNKVIEVNEEFSYAVVEPGVTFTDLYQYCASKKLRVWPSVPSLGWGSVVGNVSEILHPLTRLMLTET